MWELVKRSVQRERAALTAAQLGRPRSASVQRMHNEIVEAFLKAGRQRVRRTASSSRLGRVDSVAGEGARGRGVRGGIWRAVSSLGFAIAMAIRLLNPYVLISVAFSQHRSLMAHLSARVDSMRAVLSPRIGRRRRLTAWVQDILPQRHVPEAASAVWMDGSLLCGIVETAVPGSCPGYDSLSPPSADRGATLWLGQKLAARYLGVPPAFSDDEFSQQCLTVYTERRMLRYLSALKAASARVEAERQRRVAVLQSNGRSAEEEDAFSLDTIAHSSLPPGESLLECVARGMGLVLGVQGRKSTFYLYLNPHHPHRHIHRLMQRTNTLERQPSFEDEAGAILMQIRGPEGDFGAALLSTSPGSSSSTTGPSLAILNEQWSGRIPISYETTEESVSVSFVPQSSGRHELILLQRGGSHVPGSPFLITVEESSEVPDDDGRRRRFGSEPVDGLVVSTPIGITKTTSYESGLDKGHRRVGSEGSDPGSRSEGDSLDGMRKKRRVVARVVDFVSEKMLLTEDGKLEKIPKRRRGLQKMPNEDRGLPTADDEVREIMQNRRYSNLFPMWGRIKYSDIDGPIYGTYPGRRMATTYGLSKSGHEMDTNVDDHCGRVHRGGGKNRGGDTMVRVSDVASHKEKESLDSINFREHCRRILWLCDILLKHSPRQEGLEILNTAGDILEGKRVHPTILEESEPEDVSTVAPSSTHYEQPSAQPYALKARARTAMSTSYALSQRLQRASSDTGGLNEVTAWKGGRRQFHSWSRQDREGGDMMGGRLLHKGGSYRGVVVRDMTPEALTGAYAGGEDKMEDDGSPQRGELEDLEKAEERYLLEGSRPAPRMPHHSLPKRKHPSLAKQMESRGQSMEALEQRTSTSDREKDGGRATVSGKELNKFIASSDKRQINYSDRVSKRAHRVGGNEDREKGTKASASRNEGGLKDHPKRYSEKEDKRPFGFEGKSIIFAAAVALAEGGRETKGEEESWEESLSNMGTRAIPGKEKDAGENDKELLDASSKGEPAPVEEFKEEGGGGGDERDEGREAVAYAGGECGVEEEEERETRRVSAAPASAEAEAPGAREINGRLRPPPSDESALPTSPTTHGGPGTEQSPVPPEGMASKSSDVAGGSTSSGSGYPRINSEKRSVGEEREPIKEEEEGREEAEKGTEKLEEEAYDGEEVKGKVIGLEDENKEAGETGMETAEVETSETDHRKLTKKNEKFEEEVGKEGGATEKEDKIRIMEEKEKVKAKLAEKEGDRAENSSESGKREVGKIVEEKSTNIKEDRMIVDNLVGREEKMCVVQEKSIGDEDAVETVSESKVNRDKGVIPKKKSEEEENMMKYEQEETQKIREDYRQEIREENENIERSDTRKEEEKRQQLPGTEMVNVRDEESRVEEKTIEARGEKIEEINSVNITESSKGGEAEKIKEDIFVNKYNQVVVITEEVDSVKDTIAGNEDENVETSQATNKQVGDTEESFEPQNSTIAKEDKKCEVNSIETLQRGSGVESEKVDRIAMDEGKVGEIEKDNKAEREKVNEFRGSEENKVIAGEREDTEAEAAGKEIQKYIESHGSRKIFVDEDITDVGEESSKIEEVTIIEKNDSDELSMFSEGKDIRVEGGKGEELGTMVIFEGQIKEKVMSEGEEKQAAIYDVVHLKPEGNVLGERFGREFRCEDTCGLCADGGLQNKEESKNEKMPSEDDRLKSDENESVISALQGQFIKEEKVGTGETLPICEIQEDESRKRLGESEPKAENSNEGKKEKEENEKQELKEKEKTSFRVDMGEEDVVIRNLKENTLSEKLKTNAEEGAHGLEESKNLDAHIKTERCEVKETKKSENIFDDETCKERGGGSERELQYKEFETSEPKELSTKKESEEEFLDEESPKKLAFEEDGTAREKEDQKKIVAPREKIKEKESRNEKSEDTLIKEGRVEKKENETLSKEESSKKPKDGYGEKTKIIMPQKDKTLKDEDIANIEYERKGKNKIRDGACLKSEEIPAKEDGERDKKENENNGELTCRKGTNDEIGQIPAEGMERGANKTKELNKNTLIKVAGAGIKENKDDKIILKEEEKNKKENEGIREIEGEQMVEEEIKQNELIENTVTKEEISFEGVKIERIAHEESIREKKGDMKHHGPPVEEESNDKMESRVSRVGEGQENEPVEDTLDKEELNVSGVAVEGIVCDDSQHVKKENTEKYYTPGEEEITDEVSRMGEIKEKVLGENPSTRGEIKLYDFETERTAFHEESHQEKYKMEHCSNITKEENRHLRERTISLETMPNDKVEASETEGGKSRQTPLLVEIGVKPGENELVTSTSKTEIKDEVRHVETEGTLSKGGVDNEVEVSENTSVRREQTVKIVEEKQRSSPKEEKTKEGAHVERIPTKEEWEVPKESEKVSADIAQGIGGTKEEEKWMNRAVIDSEIQALNLKGAEDGKKGEGVGRGGCKSERIEDISEPEGGKAEGGMSEAEKCSKEDHGETQREGKMETPSGEEERSLTYGEIIGRILYVDSFPSESLEWFEEEGRKGAGVEVEGTMESMEGHEGGPGATAEMAVGDEAWEEPEISLKEPFRPEVGDPGGPETQGKEGAVIGGGVEDESKGEEEEDEEEVNEEDGRDQWSAGLPSNIDDEDQGRGSFHRKCADGGPSLRMGVGVVVAGGIVSRDATRRDSSEGEDGTWRRRSRWRASRSKSIEEGLPLHKDDPAGREWEEICMGIDAMEDGSISEVIAEVSGKRRRQRRRTRKERGERSSKAIRVYEGRGGRDGDDRTHAEPFGKGVPVVVPPMESVEAENAKGEAVGGGEMRVLTPGRPPTKGDGEEEVGGCETSVGVGGEGDAMEGEKEASKGERAAASREGSCRVGMLGEPWWLSSSRSGSLGGIKIEELRVDWVGAMEQGKRGRGPPEEEGVEAKEEAKVVKNKANEGDSGEGRRVEKEGEVKRFLNDKGDRDFLSETAPPGESEIKVDDAKNLECPPQSSNTEIRSDFKKRMEQKDMDENVQVVEIEVKKCDDVFEAASKYVEINETEEVRESDEKANTIGGGELERDAGKEGEEKSEEEMQEEEDDEEENEKAAKGTVPSYGEEKGLEAIKVELEETKLREVFVVGESDKCQRDNEVKGSKSMQSVGDEIFLELENEQPRTGEGNAFGCGVENRGKLAQAESSGEWEFVDTGGHFAENENPENVLLGEWKEQRPCNKYASSTKGLFLGSFLGNADNVESPGAVGMGMKKVNNLLQSFVDISQGEERTSTEGTSPKREGEEMCGVRMTLDEWEREKGPDYIGPETEVVVGEFDLLGDWVGAGGTMGVFEVATKGHQRSNRKDEVEVENEVKNKEIEHKSYVKGYNNKDSKQSGEDYSENEVESSNVSPEEYVSSDASDSHRNCHADVENNTTEDDDDIEEIVRTEPDEWSKDGFTFTDTDHRSTFRSLEDLLGGEMSFRMSACSAQFNLWPSQEAFGGRRSWMEHIDMDAFMSTTKSRQQSSVGTGLLQNMTAFAKTYIVGDHKGSTTTSEQYNFSRCGEDTERRINENVKEEEEEIVLEEQDFDDRNDEIKRNLETGPHCGSTYHSFDIGSHPRVRKGDAFIIFETPGVTTYATQENEQMSSDEDSDDKSSTGRNVGKAILCEDDEMEGFELSGEWEEGVIFLDDDDNENVQTDGRRGSGEYRKFGGEMVEKMETELWGVIPQVNDDTASGDMAFAVVMNPEEREEKTPVHPTGRWCPRLPMLSPAMSAISEEENEEILPEKDTNEGKESASFKVKKEASRDIITVNREMKKDECEKSQKDPVLPKPMSRKEIPKDHTEDFDEGEESGSLKVTLHPDDDEMYDIPAENLEESDPRHKLPKLDVEVEDGFGESFARRRSSTSSVISDSGTVEPVADCGAAFVVSSELAVTLALGVSITQIIPPVIDLPDIPPLPQVEEATDALSIGKIDEELRSEHCTEEYLKTEGDVLSVQTFENLQQQKDTGMKFERISYMASTVGKNREGEILKKTIETQTEPILVLKERKQLVDNSVMVEEDILMMETTISESIKPANKEVEGKIADQRLDSDASALMTQGETAEEKSSLLMRKNNLAPNALAYRIESEFQGGKEEYRNKNTQRRERDVNEVSRKGEVDEFDANKNERINEMLNYTASARKTIPKGTTEVKGEGDVAENKNHRDLNAFEKELIEKDEKKSQGDTIQIGKENRVERRDRGNNLPCEQEFDWYDNERERIECYSDRRLVTKAFAEREDVEHKKFEEEKRIVFEEKQKVPEKEKSELSAEETGGENNRLVEGTAKSSPHGGVRKKESLEEKSKGSPPTTIPLEKLLGWPSENGNGNGLGCAGVASRRESVFDDYNFSLWENGFQLKSDPDNQRLKSQDSTGLEYYLDVDQLLNVPLAATEPEVKYVSAKEIMDTFTRGEGIDSPEKIVEKEVESRRKKMFKSDSLDEEAAGGLSIELLGGGLMDGAAGFSNERGDVTVCIGKGANPLEDDLFAEFSQDSFMPGTQKEMQTSGRNVRNIIGIFEHPSSTKIEKEMSPVKVEKGEKYPQTIFGERTPTEDNNSLRSVLEVHINQPAIQGVEARELTETENETIKRTDGESRITLSPLVDITAEGGRKSEAETFCKKQEKGEPVFLGRAQESKTKEFDISEAKEIFNGGTTERRDVKPPTLENKRDALLSLTEEPVVGWEAIKVATEVEKIILSTGNGAEQKKIIGGVVIGAETEKIFGAMEQSEKGSAKDAELESNCKETIREPTEERKGLSDSETRTDKATVGDHSGVRVDARTSCMGRPSTSSFEEYRTVVCEAYQFLDSLGDTIDEDEERLSEEAAKEPGGKAEDSVGGTGSEVEEFHPCEELPDDGREAIPRGVEGAPTEGLVDAQSPPSSPERYKTTESSSSSSPHSSLPTFADVSSGILSSASSKDENSMKTGDGASRRERAFRSEFRGALEAEVERTDGGSVMPEDYLDEEIDSSALAKMNVASRKEYWDRRLQRAREKSKDGVTAGAKKPPPLRVSGIVARGRMSFEKSRSRDEYTTSDSGGDGGKSSSESSPSWHGKSFSRRPKAVYSRGTKSALPSKMEGKSQWADRKVLPQEKELLKTLEELSIGATGMGSNDTLDKEIPMNANITKQQEQPLKKLEDKEDLSQIPVAKRKEIWDQKLQKMSEEESPPSSLEHRRMEKKKSSRVEMTEKRLGTLSTEDKMERKDPSIGIKDIVPKHKPELEEQSLSIDSSSLDSKAEHEEVIKKNPPIKTTGSVSRLAKLFSSPTPEPPPTKYGRGHPVPKGKYSKGLDKDNIKSKGEPIEENRSKVEIPTPLLVQGNTEISHSMASIRGTGSLVLRKDEIISEKVPIDGKGGKKIENNGRTSSTTSTEKNRVEDTVKGSSLSAGEFTPEPDNLASRRKKYLASVQQSLEGEEIRNEIILKKTDSEDLVKERRDSKGITDVRNIWEKRASLDGSSSSESIKKSGKTASTSTATNTEKKKPAQDKSMTTKGKMRSSDKTKEIQLQGEAILQETEGRRQADSLHEMLLSQQKEALSIATSYSPHEVERRKGDTLPRKVLSQQDIYRDEEPASKTPVSLNIGGCEADLVPRDSREIHEGKSLSYGEPSQKIIQSTNKIAQLTDPPNRDENKRKLPYSDNAIKSNKGKATGKSPQQESKVSIEETAQEKFAPREKRAPPDESKSPLGKGLPPEMEDPPPAMKKMASEATTPSAFKGRRHSSACVNPPKKMNVSKVRDRWGSLEEKATESAGTRAKRDSMEIRVTDDEDVCVLREVTSVPRFLPKEKMETHEEEDGRHSEDEEDDAIAEEELSKVPPLSGTGAKRGGPLPQRTLSIQVSGIVASGRRRFEIGKATAEDMPTLSEEVGERVETESQAPRNIPATRRGPEERRRVPTLAVDPEDGDGGEQGREGGRRSASASKGRRATEREALREEGARLRAPAAAAVGGREMYKAVPISVTVEGEHRGVDVRVEVCDSEETSLASKGGEGSDDGRSATSRRSPKGKAPAQKQPPPSTASSPDTESEGAADTKLLGFLSTPAAQIRRHSALDVATLRSFAAQDGPRMRRRGSGDLETPSRPKEDESKKRFSRARNFFETLDTGKERPASQAQSGGEDGAPGKAPSGTQSASKKKKKNRPKDDGEGAWRGSVSRRAGVAKQRPPVAKESGDSSGSTAESDKEKRRRRKARRGTSEGTHSAPGSDVDSSGSAPHDHPSLHKRKRERELVLRSQRFGGSEREVKVSERFNVMDLFRDVVGPGTGVSSGRATPLGIPHQAAVLAALRSVEDVRRCETTSPYDMYRPVEADDDCEPKSAGATGEEGGEPVASANEENAGAEEGNVTFSSPLTLCVKKEYQAEYPHLPMTSPRHSRHRSSNTDLIPRNVLLQLDTNQSAPKKPSSSRRSIAELF